MTTLAEVLSAERDRQGLTTNAVAVRAGMSAGQATRLFGGETVNPGIETVGKVLEVLGKDLKWLQRQLDASR